jgi:hypothetical protein
MLVFITSTSKDLYTRDVLNVCCKGTGDLVSFSYNKGRISIRNTNAKGQRALIIFAEYKEGASPRFIFHPVRFCTVIEIIDSAENSSYTYNLKLADCFIYDYDPGNAAINDVLINKLNQEISPQIAEGVDNLSVYFRELDIKTPFNSRPIEETSVWPNMAKYFGKLKIFEGSVFFRQLTTADGIDFKETDLKFRKPIKLKAGKVYNLSFLLIAGKVVKGSGVYPTIETGENVSTQGPFISQESNAIALRYVLITKSTATDAHSVFIMKAKVNPTDTSPISPEISNYFIITPGRWLNFVAISLIVLGLIGSNLADLFVQNNKIYIFFNSLSVSGENLSKGLKVIASVLIAFMTFFTFRKIPKSE